MRNARPTEGLPLLSRTMINMIHIYAFVGPLEVCEEATMRSDREAPEQPPRIPSTAVRCDICKILLENMQAYDAHAHGEGHKHALTKLAFASTQNVILGYIRCPVCERDLPAAHWDAHLARDQYHRKRQQYADVTAQVQSAHLNRNGISVTGEAGGIDFGIVEVADVRGLSAEQTMEVTISNEAAGNLTSLASVKFSSAYKRDSSSRYIPSGHASVVDSLIILQLFSVPPRRVTVRQPRQAPYDHSDVPLVLHRTLRGRTRAGVLRCAPQGAFRHPAARDCGRRSRGRL